MPFGIPPQKRSELRRLNTESKVGVSGDGRGHAEAEHYTSCHTVSHSLLETAGKMTEPSTCSKIWDHICKEAELELHRCAVIPASGVHMYPQVKGGL